MPGPGDRIEARCTRCQDVTGHIVVVMAGSEIAKVECCACGSVHKYIPPTGPRKGPADPILIRNKEGQQIHNAAAAKSPQNMAKQTPQPKPGKAARAIMQLEQDWMNAINKNAAEPRPYSMNESFAVGEVVSHPKFGLGAVQEIIPPDKMKILFRDGFRLLRCAVA